jgi:hypothetical protein
LDAREGGSDRDGVIGGRKGKKDIWMVVHLKHFRIIFHCEHSQYTYITHRVNVSKSSLWHLSRYAELIGTGATAADPVASMESDPGSMPMFTVD